MLGMIEPVRTSHATPHPRTNTPPAELRSLHDEISKFLNRRFAGQSGWFCLGWLDGDPDVDEMSQEWYQLPRQARQVVGRYVELAERGYNLYVVPCLFRVQKRAYTTALPSRWLWIDDATIAGAELVESSGGNFQSWVELDQAISAQERSDLQRAMRDQTAGADTCSADAVHFARMPGGWNCKRHGAWRVRVAQLADRVFSVEELRRRYPQATPAPRQATAAGDWSSLPNGSRLAYSGRFQALVRANEQLRKVCAGAAVPIRMKNGRDDDSPSNQRAVFVCQLIRAHYPHAEIQALADHFRGVLESKPKGFEEDIDDLVEHYTPEGYKPEPTRNTTIATENAPPRGGRHHALTRGELLDYLHQHAECGRRGLVVDQTRGEIATGLNVSYGTVQRVERELEGEIRREASPDRQRSYIILTPDTWDNGSERITARCDQTSPRENDADQDVRSQPDLAHQDAANTPETAQCIKERAHVENTHLPPEGLMVPADRPAGWRVLRCGPRWYGTNGTDCTPTFPTAAAAWAAVTPAADDQGGVFFQQPAMNQMLELEQVTPERRGGVVLNVSEWAEADQWLKSPEGHAFLLRCERHPRAIRPATGGWAGRSIGPGPVVGGAPSAPPLGPGRSAGLGRQAREAFAGSLSSPGDRPPAGVVGVELSRCQSADGSESSLGVGPNQEETCDGTALDEPILGSRRLAEPAPALDPSGTRPRSGGGGRAGREHRDGRLAAPARDGPQQDLF